MEFRYTEKVGYIIVVVSIFAPFFISIQEQFSDDALQILIFGPFWQLYLNGWEIFHFAMNPFVPFLTLPLWGPGLYIAKITIDEAKVQEKTRYEFAMKITKVLFVQMILLILLSLASVSMPEPFDIPLPIAGILALLLTPITVKGEEKIWEEDAAFTEEEANQ